MRNHSGWMYIPNQIGFYFRDYVLSERINFNFDSKWCELAKDEVSEHQETFQLPYKTYDDVVNNMIKYLGLIPHSNTEKCKQGEKRHKLLLYGKLITGQLVLAQIMIGFTAELGCVAKVIAKCADETVPASVLKSIC